MNRKERGRGPLLCAIVLGAALLSNCTPRVQPGAPSLPPAPSVADAEEIRISRGPCFGFCPVYSIAVAPGGQVQFTGERHTTVIGTRSRTVGPAGYEAVRKSLAPLRPASGTRQDYACDAAATDMSQVTVEWVSAAGARTAFSYNMGCRSPKGLDINRTVEEQLQKLDGEGWAAQKTWPGATRG